MKYYTIRMFSEGTILETLTTKVAVDSMPDKTVKLLMNRMMLMKLRYMRVPIGDTMKQTIWVTKLNLLEQLNYSI